MRVPVSVIAQNGKGFIVGEAIKYASQKIQFIDVNLEALGNYYLYNIIKCARRNCRGKITRSAH